MTGPRFYLILPSDVALDRLDALLPALVDAADVAAIELDREAGDGAAWDQLRAADLATAQSLGIAVLLRDRAELAAGLGADGVALSSAGAYREARAALGGDRIAGVWTGSSRHEAMVAAEAGADFVGLTPDPELVAWWAGLVEVPCVTPAADAEAARTLAVAGADFLATGPSLWEAEDPAAALRSIADAAAAARS